MFKILIKKAFKNIVLNKLFRYKVHPESELNFGPLLVGATKVEPITIENVGSFEFDFRVLTLEQDHMEKLEVSLLLLLH